MDNASNGWQRGSFRHSVGEAFLWSLSLYAVPAIGSDVVAPLGLVFPLAIKEAAVWTLWPVLVWQMALAAAHLWRLCSHGWVRWITWAPIAILTTGPLYWFVFWLPPSREEIAEMRKPELGVWEEVCRLEGPYQVAPMTRAASDAGEAWVLEGQVADLPRRLSKIRTETNCSLTNTTLLPSEAQPLAAHRGHVAYSFEDALYLSNEVEGASALWSRGYVQDVVFSEDGAWIVWSQSSDPANADSPYALVVQRTDGTERRSTRLRLSPDKPYPSDLLAYDPLSRETTLELASRAIARVDANGAVVFKAPQPDGCRGEFFGAWILHPEGWAYAGATDCELTWELHGRRRVLDLQSHLGEIPLSLAGVGSASISPDGMFIAFATHAWLNHHFASPVSIGVVRAEGGDDFARIHLGLEKYREASILFLGQDHLLVAEDGLIRLIRLHR